MLVAEVDPVDPRRVNRIWLCVLALALAEELGVVDIVHEAVAAVSIDKTELVGRNLVIGRDVDGIVGITVTIHVIGEHIRVVVSSAPCFIDKAVVVAAQVVEGRRSDHTVRSDILGVVQLDIVDTSGGRNISNCRLGVGTWQTGDLLGDGVRVGSHEAEVLKRAGIDGDVA